MKKLSQMTAAQRQARVKKLAANPATRSAVPDKYLPESYKNQRAMNARLNAPAIEGSSLTNRDVSRQANAAAQVKYGQPVAQANTNIQQAGQLAKDQAHWYDDYLAKLGQAQTSQAQIGQHAVDQIGSLAGAFGAPDTTGQSAGVAGDAGKAAAVRQAILKNVGATTAAQAGNQNAYANTLANVVAPGQKLQAQASGAANVQKYRDALADLVKEEGSYKEQVKGDTIAAEQKNVLANQALGLDVAKASTSAGQAAASLAETTRAHKASETNTANSTKQQAQANAQKINSYGYTNADWSAMTTEQRRKIINSSKTTPKGKSTYLAPASQNTFKRTFDAAKTTATKLNLGVHYGRDELRGLLKNGRQAQTVFVDANGKPIPDVYSIAAAQKKDKHARPVNVPAVKPITDDAVLSAVLDTVLDGHLSQYTIKKLHQAGIKVNALGVPTKPTTATKVNSTLSSVGQMLGQIGGG